MLFKETVMSPAGVEALGFRGVLPDDARPAGCSATASANASDRSPSAGQGR